MQVHRLDEITINQIAAGEVIERPASVVKELVENAIDSGATQINIEIKNGGRQLIKVSDNGCGMTEEDAVLAIERHATSKITTASDLLNIGTLGFRGEALPSIAAISSVQITTKLKESDSGTLLEVVGGILKKVKTVGAADGTTIVVEDLFYNTPARLKYLKTIPTETGYITDFVSKLALGNPEIAFSLKHHECELLFSPGTGDLRDAILSLYGKNLGRDILPIDESNGRYRIHGFLGKPAIARNNRKQELFYVNGRSISSRLLGSSVEKAYHTLLPIARYPFVVLFLEINLEEVDVNVHPSKLEVRFSEESELFRFIYHAIQNCMKKNSLITEWINPIKEDETIPTVSNFGTSAPFQPHYTPTTKSLNYTEFQKTTVVSPTEIKEVSESYADIPDVEKAPTPPEENFNAANTGNPSGFFVYPRTVADTYIIAQDEKGLLFVDQHAAHERILYEKFMKKASEILDKQSLLLPETIDLSYQQYKVVSDRLHLFNELGFEVETFGGRSLVIRTVPLPLLNMDYSQIILDLIEEYSNYKTFKTPAEIKESFIITMACRSAIKAGDKVSVLEMENLLRDLLKCENPYTCPHGRPTIFRMSIEELAKKFLRR